MFTEHVVPVEVMIRIQYDDYVLEYLVMLPLSYLARQNQRGLLALDLARMDVVIQIAYDLVAANLFRTLRGWVTHN